MAGIRRSATMRMEEGDATPVAWSSATDNATKDTTNDDADSEKAELEGHRQSQESTPGRRIRNHMPLTVNRFLNLDAQSFSPQTESSSTRKATVNGDARAEEPAPQRSIFKEAIDDNEANNFESVVDLPPLPKLDFKPLILREWTLICIAVFYLGIIAVLGVLYHSGNSARYFHIHATASRFTIRYLPSLIGTLSQLIFQSVLLNFARLLPYIVMAVPVKPEDKCATARQTLLAPYFPVFGLFGPYHAIQNRHFGLAIMGIVANFVNPFLTPAKSALIHKRVSGQDPHLWTISISDASAKYLLLNYSINFLIVLGLLVYLWDRRTGLKWDPVSLADHSMLLQRSDVLDDFSGLEYWSWKGEKTHRLYGLETERYRLGYWRDQRTNKYWHGIRKWPASTRSSSTQNAIDTRPETRPETRPDNVLRTNQEPLVRSPLVPAATPAVESIQDDISPRVDRADPQYAGARGYRTARKIPDITDSSSKCHGLRMSAYV